MTRLTRQTLEVRLGQLEAQVRSIASRVEGQGRLAFVMGAMFGVSVLFTVYGALF